MKSGPRGARATRTSRALEPSTRGRRTRAPRAREDPRGAASRPESPPTKSSRPTTTPRRRGVARRGNGDCVCSRLRCSSPRRARGSTPPRSPPWTSRRATARCSSPSRGESSGESHLARPARIQPHERRRVTTPRRQGESRTKPDAATRRRRECPATGRGRGAAARLPVTARCSSGTFNGDFEVAHEREIAHEDRSPRTTRGWRRAFHRRRRGTRVARRGSRNRAPGEPETKKGFTFPFRQQKRKKSSKKASACLMCGSTVSTVSGSRRSRRSRIPRATPTATDIDASIRTSGVPPRARRGRRPGASPRCGDSSRRAPSGGGGRREGGRREGGRRDRPSGSAGTARSGDERRRLERASRRRAIS